MALLDGLLPIIEKKDSSRPITVKNKESIRQLLIEEARFERLALKSINSDPRASEYYLEPIPHQLFDIYQYEEDTVVQDAAQDTLSLIPVGKLALFDDSDSETVDLNTEMTEKEPITKFDLAAYQEIRRALIQQQNTIDLEVEVAEASPVPTTPGLSVDTPRLTRSVLGVPPAAATTPVTAMVPPQAATEPLEQQQAQKSAIEDEYQPDTQEVREMVRSVLADNSEDSIMEDAVLELGSTVTAVIEPPTALAVVVHAATTAEEERWYRGDEITTMNPVPIVADTSKGKNIYTLPEKMVPIFATQEQQVECDKVVSLANSRPISFLANFNKSIDALNFPTTMLDLELDEQWNQSGKIAFIKQLLESLIGQDKMILIVTKGMNDEEILFELIGDSLKLNGCRISSLLDEKWDGEYGVMVNTKQKRETGISTQAARLLQQQFSPHADLMICLDIRISSDHAIFTKFARTGDTEDKGIPPPAIWLIVLGSVEDRAFQYLKSAQIPISDAAKLDEFKALMKKENSWPITQLNSEALNRIVATNVKSWLLSSSAHTTIYQYRSIVTLPAATHSGYTVLVEEPATAALTATTTTTTTLPATRSPLIQDSTEVDMEMDSETEDDLPSVISPAAPSAVVLSDKVKRYLENFLIPPFDINNGQLKQVSREQELLTLSDADKRIIEKLQPTVYAEYCAQINTLKRQYQVAFEELHEKYRAKGFEAASAPK